MSEDYFNVLKKHLENSVNKLPSVYFGKDLQDVRENLLCHCLVLPGTSKNNAPTKDSEEELVCKN